MNTFEQIRASSGGLGGWSVAGGIKFGGVGELELRKGMKMHICLHCGEDCFI